MKAGEPLPEDMTEVKFHGPDPEDQHDVGSLKTGASTARCQASWDAAGLWSSGIRNSRLSWPQKEVYDWYQPRSRSQDWTNTEVSPPLSKWNWGRGVTPWNSIYVQFSLLLAGRIPKYSNRLVCWKRTPRRFRRSAHGRASS